MKVEITAPIEDIKGSTGITDMGDADYTLKMKVQITPGDYARLMAIQRQRVALKMTITAEQAMFDLAVAQIGLKTEQKPPEKPTEALKDAKPADKKAPEIPFVEGPTATVEKADAKVKASSGKAG